MEENKKSLISSIRSRFQKNRLGELLVLRGKLTPEQLRTALKHQQQSGEQLGTIVQNLNFVTKTDIRTSLFEQAAYRAVAAAVTLMIGFASYGVATNTAKASQLNSRILAMQQSMVQKVAFHPDKSDLAPMSSYPKLFGASEIASNDISAFTKWTEVLGKIDKIAFKNDKTEAFRNLPLDAKITAVNSYVNNFKYIEDIDNYGKTDYWATPNEFFLRGGDCEDFAIAKYSLLKELGVPENRMRLAIVQDKIKNVPHAVLIVYSDNGGILLDNQIKTAKKVASVTRYKPIYSINAENWWRHIS